MKFVFELVLENKIILVRNILLFLILFLKEIWIIIDIKGVKWKVCKLFCKCLWDSGGFGCGLLIGWDMWC